jgi:hypothetical protein
MGVKSGPRIVTNGLIFDLDAAVSRSYSGTGLTANGLIGGIGGTLVNGVGFTSSNNGSFIFDGSNDYIVSNIDLRRDFSLSCWVYQYLSGFYRLLKIGGYVAIAPECQPHRGWRCWHRY